MKKSISIIIKSIAMVALLMVSAGVHAAEVVYRIVEYNKTTQDFVLSASGQVPKGSYAWFENKYGATTGNRYNQIPRNTKATLWLSGWQGCTIKGITFSMCSNNKAGQVGFSVGDGEETLCTFRPCDFADEGWFGQWVSKDLGVYVDITRAVEARTFASDLANITLQGGSSEGSVYIDAITIDYDEAPGTTLESPLGWSYEKLEKKSTLQEGDEVMMFRNGCAAADIDGMESDSHYLDAIAVASTGDVSDPEVLRFTLCKSADNSSHWVLTDQHGRKLGAKGKGALAWDEGVATWTIDLGYDGATIASTNTSYGTLRFNAPAESYARFALYTSKTLPLPFLYRKVKQNEAVVSSSLSLGETEKVVALSEGHVALCPTVSPKKVTDQRIVWTSSNEEVATVNGGFVTLKAEGTATITARMKDGGAEAALLLTVADDTGITSTTAEVRKPVVRKVADRQGIVITTPNHRYGVNGVERR